MKAYQLKIPNLLFGEDWFTWIYDFGDDWSHRVEIGKLLIEDLLIMRYMVRRNNFIYELLGGYRNEH